MQQNLICHLVSPVDWEKALDKGVYKPESLKKEGFIHCSTQAQLAESARIHFAEEKELVVLYLLPKRFGEKLKYEKSRNGELFPHIYGPIQLEQVETTRMLVKEAGDSYEII